MVNGILYNSEVWYGVTKSQVEELLMRRVLEAPCSTPVEALYLELGLIPIKYIFKGRRLMFLHYVLNLNEEEMLSQFLWTQWKSPVSSHWTETVKEDMDVLKIGRTIYEIKKMFLPKLLRKAANSCT